MRILILTLIIFYQCAKDNDSQDCIDKSKISNTVCIEIYDPVCSCNNITYSNIVMQMLMELLIILKENVR